MTTTSKPQSQIEKFREAARELETDDSEERFAETVKRIGQAKLVKGVEGRDGSIQRRSR